METTDFCSYELSKRLKDCGFDKPCDHYYNGHGNLNRYADTDRINRNTNGHHTPSCSAPTLAHAQKWLREKGIAVSVQANEIQGELWYSADIITTKGINELVDGVFDYMGYEAALSAGLSAALELIEQEKK